MKELSQLSSVAWLYNEIATFSHSPAETKCISLGSDRFCMKFTGLCWTDGHCWLTSWTVLITAVGGGNFVFSNLHQMRLGRTSTKGSFAYLWVNQWSCCVVFLLVLYVFEQEIFEAILFTKRISKNFFSWLSVKKTEMGLAETSNIQHADIQQGNRLEKQNENSIAWIKIRWFRQQVWFTCLLSLLSVACENFLLFLMGPKLFSVSIQLDVHSKLTNGRAQLILIF